MITEELKIKNSEIAMYTTLLFFDELLWQVSDT